MARTWFWGMLLGAAALVLMVRIGMELPDLEHGPTVPQARAAEPKKPVVLSKLSCFECHNFKRFESGKKFAHTDHQEAGHCHFCHTFQGHMQVGIRKESCAACHPEDEEEEAE